MNSRSHVINLTGFDITSCLPFDIMHTVFEGVALHHLQALLPYLIETKKFFKLLQLNTFLRTHKYHHSETKPSPINKDSDGSYHIKQTGQLQLMSLTLCTHTCKKSFTDDDSCSIAAFSHWQLCGLR